MSATGDDRELLRIGELSRRVGVKPEVLRAWERRYDLFSPTRTAGGFRLYDGQDERRVRRMLAHLANGLSAAEAARLARSESARDAGSAAAEREEIHGASSSGELAGWLRDALDAFDDGTAHTVLDRMVGSFPLDSVLRDAVLPYLHDLGDRWECGKASVAQEHFASTLLHGRLLGLARGWGSGTGPQALLACAPGDQHDLGLVCFGLALRGHGWRITYLGTDTPLPTLIQTADALQPALVVVTATLSEQAKAAVPGLRELACVAPLGLAGNAVSARLAERVGARHFDRDPVTTAADVAATSGR